MRILPLFGAHSHRRSLAPIAIAEAWFPAIAEEKQQTKKGPEGPFVIVLVGISNENA